ncbi:glycoside hydrolase family 9 protein [Litorimonas sp. RW-G-Af-16]
MMMRLFLCLLLLGLLACQPSAKASAQSDTTATPLILVDQFGYLPRAEKVAVIKQPVKGYDSRRKSTPGKRFGVFEQSTGKLVFEGAPRAWNGGKTDRDSGDKVWWFDFSAVTASGDFVIKDMDTGAQSYAFRIADDVYLPAFKAAFRTFYLQRAGFEKRPKYAGRGYAGRGYADAASHMQDKRARLYNRPNDRNTERDLHGGWYDAGDYSQYTIWTAEYVAALLSMYADNPSAWGDDFGIPESGNGIPDVLDEAMWGLDWLARMQNEDGSMLSILDRAEASPPSSAKGPSLYGPATTAASYTAAGTFALADHVLTRARVNRTKTYRSRAMRAWKWAETNPNVKFYNNTEANGSIDIGAGQQEVETDRLAKKKLIAASRMAVMTSDAHFASIVEALYNDVRPMAADTPNGFEGSMAFDMLAFVRDAKPTAQFARRVMHDYSRNIV